MLTFAVFILQMAILYFLSRQISKELGKMLYSLVRRKNLTYYLYSFFFLPGTVVHEFAHFLAALFLFVPIGDVDLIPKFNEGRLHLGSVTIKKTDIFRSIIIGLAPLIIGLLMLWGMEYYFSGLKADSSVWLWLLGFYLLFQITNTMFISTNDLKAASEGLIFLIVIVILMLILNIPVFSINVWDNLLEKLLIITDQISVYLYVAIFIDLGLLVLFKVWNGKGNFVAKR